MPMQKPRARLRWRGKESVQEILSSFDKRDRVLLILPAGFHHALTVRLNAEGAMRGSVDITSDDTALERLAHIRGLRELTQLCEPLARAGMAVRVRTPPPQILFFPRDKPMKEHALFSRPAPVVT